MRKIKNKDTKIKEKIVVRKVNENKPTYILSKCLLELPLAIKKVFNITTNEIFSYVKENKKIPYRSEVLKDEWYKGITICMNRWLKLAERLKIKREMLEIANSSYVTDEFVKCVSVNVAYIQEKFIKERLTNIDDPLVHTVTLIALISTIQQILGYKNLEMEKKDLKYMRWLTSTYTDMLCGVLHDIDSYHGFYLTTKSKKAVKYRRNKLD